MPLHTVFEMLAFTLGYQLYAWQRRRAADRISDDHRWWIFIGAAAGALVGSHTLGVLERPEELGAMTWLTWLGNKTIVGGLLGGLIGVELTKKQLGVTTSSGDLMTYPLMFGLAIGRIGCHLAGLADGTIGLPSTAPWAVDLGDGVPRHPVNLYEIVFLGALALALALFERSRPLPDGARFKLFMIAYFGWRFFIEFYKPVYFWPLGLSTIQLAAVAGLAYYAGLFLYRRRQIRRSREGVQPV
jgi:phosphatidylglycerol:prolipoprotein diacylglycerol transferase